ncbi:MAG: Thiosulfate sulfurtransferase GlpE [Myxococcota bacterium]|nr:Thiosulfate sulfurtransferase GlpE [Myxococcota bacterium]
MSGVPEISAGEARKLLDSHSAVFVDIRDPGSYGAAHIPGAQHLSDDNINEFIASTPRDAKIVVVCYHGNSSKGATMYLQENGFSSAVSLRGGFEGWRLEHPFEGK